MNESNQTSTSSTDEVVTERVSAPVAELVPAVPVETSPPRAAGGSNSTRRRSFWHAMSYWCQIVMQPVIAVFVVILLAAGFGYAQRNLGLFNDAEATAAQGDSNENDQYACSMLCVFVKAPGRCPVCGMALQKIEVPGDPKDIYGVTIQPNARRLANIQTVSALNLAVSNKIEALGKITYDETTEATISAYVGGRIDDLIVDFTGATVKKDQILGVVYSPDLYADQSGLLSAKKTLAESRSSSERIRQSNQRLYASARRRLIELGIPDSEIDAIEKRDKPSSRIRIYSPASGTVVEKMIDEGDYVKTGEAILKIADLSTVWMMLEMYPEDTRELIIGQSVTVTIQSQVGKKFEGKIAFVDPAVDSSTNTVNVRIEIPNDAGLIKIGDFGKAIIQKNGNDSRSLVVVPRDSVLINGDDSVAYVETELGRFEFRKVEVAQVMSDKIALASGIQAGEQVVASGVFMLDSTFNIQGKVSLIDPNRAVRINETQTPHAKMQLEAANKAKEQKEMEESFKKLSPEDRMLAEKQEICPVSKVRLGTHGMGVPVKIDIQGEPVMVCCEGCRKSLVNDSAKYLKVLKDRQAHSSEHH